MTKDSSPLVTDVGVSDTEKEKEKNTLRWYHHNKDYLQCQGILSRNHDPADDPGNAKQSTKDSNEPQQKRPATLLGFVDAPPLQESARDEEEDENVEGHGESDDRIKGIPHTLLTDPTTARTAHKTNRNTQPLVSRVSGKNNSQLSHGHVCQERNAFQSPLMQLALQSTENHSEKAALTNS